MKSPMLKTRSERRLSAWDFIDVERGEGASAQLAALWGAQPSWTQYRQQGRQNRQLSQNDKESVRRVPRRGSDPTKSDHLYYTRTPPEITTSTIGGGKIE